MTLLLLALAAAQADAPDCGHDRAALLALEERAFDQDMAGGWRVLADRGCDLQAAELIRDWRTARGSNSRVLFWHEGQLRANAGQSAAAIALFDRSRMTTTQSTAPAWDLYVEGSIAFLRRDRAALERARTKLAALPRPDDFPREATTADGSKTTIAWPMNLDVLDRLRRCWNQPYKTASACPPGG